MGWGGGRQLKIGTNPTQVWLYKQPNSFVAIYTWLNMVGKFMINFCEIDSKVKQISS